MYHLTECFRLGRGPGLSLLIVAAAMLPTPGMIAADYHVDALRGSDLADGLSPETAWKGLEKANAHAFEPGDRLLLRAGGVWRGTALAPQGDGAAGRPIQIKAYGSGAKPALHGDGKVPAVIQLTNQAYWEIEGLEITNYSLAASPPLARGIEIRAKDAGLVSHLIMRDLHIHRINGPSAVFSDSDVKRKSFGAIGLIIEGNQVPTAWDGVLVERCHIHDVSYVGFANSSSWTRGHKANDPSTWFPSRGIVIRNNLIERTARDGVIVRAAVSPLIERNTFLHCAIEGNGVACFPFNCDDALIQYNEAAYTRYNPGDIDAMGFDSDWNCRRTVIQYNYSHHNDHGFILVCNDGSVGFNEDTVIRYNVSYADGGNIIRFSGPVTGTRVYNNTIIVARDFANHRPGEKPSIVYHKPWGGSSRDTAFANNLIINASEYAGYEFGESEGNRYTHNVFWGIQPSTQPTDSAGVPEQPPSLPSATGNLSRDEVIKLYALPAGSPLIGHGIAQPDHPKIDFAGQPVTVHNGRVHVGALTNPQPEKARE